MQHDKIKIDDSTKSTDGPLNLGLMQEVASV